jgi:hypothetical protein
MHSGAPVPVQTRKHPHSTGWETEAPSCPGPCHRVRKDPSTQLLLEGGELGSQPHLQGSRGGLFIFLSPGLEGTSHTPASHDRRRK